MAATTNQYEADRDERIARNKRKLEVGDAVLKSSAGSKSS